MILGKWYWKVNFPHVRNKLNIARGLMAKLLAPPIIPEQSPGEGCEEIRLVWYISQFIFIDYIFDYIFVNYIFIIDFLILYLNILNLLHLLYLFYWLIESWKVFFITKVLKKQIRQCSLHCSFCLQLIWSEFSFFNWNSLHARPNSHYKIWSYKEKKNKKTKGYKKSV